MKNDSLLVGGNDKKAKGIFCKTENKDVCLKLSVPGLQVNETWRRKAVLGPTCRRPAWAS